MQANTLRKFLLPSMIIGLLIGLSFTVRPLLSQLPSPMGAHFASHDITFRLTVIDERGQPLDSVFASIRESSPSLFGDTTAKSKSSYLTIPSVATVKSKGFNSLYVMLSKQGYRKHAVWSRFSGDYSRRVVLRDLPASDPDQLSNEITELR